MPVSPKAPTFGTGAKTGHDKILINRDALNSSWLENLNNQQFDKRFHHI